MPRQSDPAKERAILDATREEVVTRGLEALSIDAVAKRAGVSTGTVYNYFPSKAILVEYLYELTRSIWVELSFPDNDEEDMPVQEGVEESCRTFLRACRDQVKDTRFLEQVENSDLYEKVVSREPPAAFAVRTALLERGKREGLLRPIDTRLLVDFLSGALTSLATRAQVSHTAKDARASGPSPDIDAVVALCWSAIALPTADAATTNAKKRSGRS